jgi:hypothetical protein
MTLLILYEPFERSCSTGLHRRPIPALLEEGFGFVVFKERVGVVNPHVGNARLNHPFDSLGGTKNVGES